MSSGVEVIILAPLLAKALVTMAAGLGAGAGAAAVAQAGQAAVKAAGDAFNALHDEYEDALSALRESEQAARREALERTTAEREAARGASSLAAITLRQAQGGTMARMLVAGLVRLEERVNALEPRPPDVARRLAELAAALRSDPESAAALFAQYLELCQVLEQAPPPEARKDAAKAEQPVAVRLRQLRALLAAPLFELPGGDERRRELTPKLEEVERLAASQPRMAFELAEELLRRVEREAERLLDEQAGRERAAAGVREKAHQLFACLTAVEGQAGLPELAARARALRAKVAGELAELEDAAFNARLEQLLEEAQALFGAAEQKLAAGMLKAVVSANVRDVLQGLGYAVADPEPEEGGSERMLVTLSDSAGIELHLSGEGQLKSEMVAFHALSDADLEQEEEHVCQVVDQLVAELRARRLEVRERFRTHYAAGERPRQVARPRRAAAPQKAAEPHRNKLGGDE